MMNSHLGRLFAGSTTNTLYTTILSQIVNDYPFSIGAEGAITITIDGDRRIVTNDTDIDKEASE